MTKTYSTFTKTYSTLTAITTAALLAMMTGACVTHAAERSTAKATIGGAQITIDYGRPTLKGRDILKLIHPGQVWRVGADAPTTLESDRDLNFGGTIVPKGKHNLLARLVEPGKWTLVFSSKSASQYNESAKIAETPLTLQEATDSAELVTIQLTDNAGSGTIEITWGKMRLSASFKPA
jgi:hypothetical protein